MTLRDSFCTKLKFGISWYQLVSVISWYQLVSVSISRYQLVSVSISYPPPIRETAKHLLYGMGDQYQLSRLTTPSDISEQPEHKIYTKQQNNTKTLRIANMFGH